MASSSPTMRGRVLLATASAGGTIAAVRNLAANWFDVRVLCSERLGAAAWSRGVSRSHSVPPEDENDRFVRRLLAIGEADPGQILLPTSDKTAWLYSKHSALLERHFRLCLPSISVIQRILDKNLLAQAAARAGIASPASWDPKDTNEVAALAPSLPYPILVKPRTHVHRLRNDKGVVVGSPSELIRQYGLFVTRERVGDNGSPFPPAAVRPILQRFMNIGSEGVQSIGGFIDRTGELFVTRGSVKVFQRSRPLGVGVCYESRPPAPSLSRAVHALCRELKYFGIFEAEFLSVEDSYAIIDFNPRLYNQIGLDIGRGMPLPLLACLDALGDEPALLDAVQKAQSEKNAGAVLYDRFTLRAMLFAMAGTSRISHQDLAYWRAWMKRNSVCAIDVAADTKDPMPGVIHSLSEAYRGFRFLPRFLWTSRALPGKARPFSLGGRL